MLEPIRILIVEDDLDWLRGLKAYLNRQPDLSVIHTVSTSEEARELFMAAEPGVDVVLMDIMLQDEPAGIGLAEQALLSWGVKVIMLTSMEEKDFIFRSFQAGAIDYQIKSRFEELPDIIRAAHARKASINAGVAEQMREEFRRLKKIEHQFKVKEVRDLITPTELQVLEMIDQGHTQTEIANRFFISLRTVKIHVGHILKKLGSSSSKDAAQKIRNLGLFDREKD
ncbi:response regulator transcription factor [Paenibacillus aceris]|uniref:Two-component system vancomycin resistance associated response regulator VraR n=1 Tax=Paenibacillus aceris TaxID=869555 RepID=A0ABS4HU27_9BACL|nr:response regulator transcription factor [Paenibacillus aceris]MBP1962137.1 two-component system vancomycin resistance associated response regulator VraR [Paenibacillus aceris]NHW34014.1 response regulator transcription factor [Paenibacillus aceris]